MAQQAAERHGTLTAGDEVAAEPNRPRSSGLLLIGLFKLGKSIFFFFVGLGALHLVHHGLMDEALRLAGEVRRFDEGRLASLLMEKMSLIDPRWLRRAEFFSFAYSALALTEGIGLTMQKVWAEYLTLSLTVMFLPWELWELAKRPTSVRFGLLLINLLVLAYLLWILDRKKQPEAALA